MDTSRQGEESTVGVAELTDCNILCNLAPHECKRVLGAAAVPWSWLFWGPPPMSPLRVSLLEVPLLPSLIGQLLLLLCHIVLVMKCYFAELFHFNEVYYNIIFFHGLCFGCCIWTLITKPKGPFSYGFLQKFLILCFIFRSMMDFQLIFAKDIRCLDFFGGGNVQFIQKHL